MAEEKYFTELTSDDLLGIASRIRQSSLTWAKVSDTYYVAYLGDRMYAVCAHPCGYIIKTDENDAEIGRVLKSQWRVEPLSEDGYRMGMVKDIGSWGDAFKAAELMATLDELGR